MDRPNNEVKDKAQVDREQLYMVYELLHDAWHIDRSYYGTYFMGEGESYIQSSCYAVVPIAHPEV